MVRGRLGVWLKAGAGTRRLFLCVEGKMTKRRKGGVVPRITRNKGRGLQQAAPSRRKLFDAERKERFLEYFCGEANLSWAARKVGVHYRTVLRHRATDPAFGE